MFDKGPQEGMGVLFRLMSLYVADDTVWARLANMEQGSYVKVTVLNGDAYGQGLTLLDYQTQP